MSGGVGGSQLGYSWPLSQSFARSWTTIYGPMSKLLCYLARPQNLLAPYVSNHFSVAFVGTSKRF